MEGAISPPQPKEEGRARVQEEVTIERKSFVGGGGKSKTAPGEERLRALG